MKSVAIVGSGGFIGSQLSLHLESYNYHVLKFDSKSPLYFDERIRSQLSTVQTIVWCASRVNPITAQSRQDLVTLELEEWKNFLSTCNTYFELSKSIIFLSSGGCVYTANRQFFSEHDEALGNNQYGRLKIEMETALIKNGFPGKVLRVANTYGPGQLYGRGQGVIAEWISSVQSSGKIQAFGPLNSFRDYIFIEDLCFAIQAIIEYKGTENTFNVGTGIATTLQEIADILLKISSNDIKITTAIERRTDRMGYYLDISKIKRRVGWSPKYSLESGILKTYIFSRNNFIK